MSTILHCDFHVFLLVAREEFQQVFDERVDKIFQLLDSQIRQLQNTHARETIVSLETVWDTFYHGFNLA